MSDVYRPLFVEVPIEPAPDSPVIPPAWRADRGRLWVHERLLAVLRMLGISEAEVIYRLQDKTIDIVWTSARGHDSRAEICELTLLLLEPTPAEAFDYIASRIAAATPSSPDRPR